MFLVEKKEDSIFVSVKLAKRVVVNQEIISLSWKDALAAAKEQLPDEKFVETPKNKFSVSNMKNDVDATWEFPLIKEKKKEQPPKPQKQEQDVEKNLIFSKKPVKVDKKTENSSEKR